MAHGFQKPVNNFVSADKEANEEQDRLNAEISKIAAAITAAANNPETLRHLQQQAEQLFATAQQKGITINGYSSADDLIRKSDKEEKGETATIEQPIPSFLENPFGWMIAKGEQYMERLHQTLGGVAQDNIKQRALDGHLPKPIEQLCEAKIIAKERALELLANGDFELLSNIQQYSGERNAPSATPSKSDKSVEKEQQVSVSMK